MQLHIKNMVCNRCIAVVQQQLHQLGFEVKDIALGLVTISPEPDEVRLGNIASALKILGFELIDKEKDQTIERIKNIIIEVIHHSDSADQQPVFSQLLADRLHKDYHFLSRLFSSKEELTIEKFIIQQKVEKIKELLQYGELNLNEIALKMGYSSSAHLSNQFKSITGLSPSSFKLSSKNNRKPIDKV